MPAGGTEAAPTGLFVANAGTAARFLTAMVCLGVGVYRLRRAADARAAGGGARPRAARARLPPTRRTTSCPRSSTAAGRGPGPSSFCHRRSLRRRCCSRCPRRLGGVDARGLQPRRASVRRDDAADGGDLPEGRRRVPGRADASSASYFHAVNAPTPTTRRCASSRASQGRRRRRLADRRRVPAAHAKGGGGGRRRQQRGGRRRRAGGEARQGGGAPTVISRHAPTDLGDRS